MIDLSGRDDSGLVWESLLRLSQEEPYGWTLIGAQMVSLHAYENDRVPPRFTTDADVLVDVRVVAGGTERFVKTLGRLGFSLDGVSPDGIGHRFSSGNVSIDVLAPEGVGERASLKTAANARTVSVPGGTQALRRTELIEVHVSGVTGVIPRPNLLGAILVKARAVTVDDVPMAQLRDVAFLCSLVDDPEELASRLQPAERKWLRIREELAIKDSRSWRFLTADEAYEGYRAFRVLARIPEPTSL